MRTFREGDLVCFLSTNTPGRWFHGRVVSGRHAGRYYMVEDRSGWRPRPVNEDRLQRDSGHHGPRWTSSPIPPQAA